MKMFSPEKTLSPDSLPALSP